MKLCIAAAVNNDEILSLNLARSSMVKAGTQFLLMRDYTSASLAYNAALARTDADVVVFVHQDVYLPAPWQEQLIGELRQLNVRDPDWSIAGVYGITPSGHVGHCWSSGLNRKLGAPFSSPHTALSLDEIVIVLRVASGVRFDEALPGFHLYGTDIVQSALASGHGAYVIHAPVVHNSKRVRSLAGPYSDAYRYMQRKWRARLPIATTVVPITRTGYPLWRYHVRSWLRAKQAKGGPVSASSRSGPQIAQELGFD